MQLYVSNKVYIAEATKEVFRWCKDNLEFPNPEYAKKQNMGLWTGNTEPMIVLWERKGDMAILPYGCLEPFRQHFGIPRNEVKYKSKKTERQPIDYQSSISLFNYQQDVLANAPAFRSGVIIMPCGSGKTQTALEIVARYKSRVLWLTHTQDLLEQSKERALSCYGIDPATMGVISEGKVNVGTSITFATVQTMSNIDLEPYKDYWDVIIVDECHRAVGTPTKLMMFYRVVSKLYAYVKIGLTATPTRNDGLERCMFALLGPTLYTVPESAVAANTVPIKVCVISDSSYNPDPVEISKPDGTLDNNKIMQTLCHCDKRNQHIADLVTQMNNSGKTCLVLSDRVEHLRILRSLVGEEHTKQVMAKGGNMAAKAERKECIEKLKTKELRCLFATYMLAKEGLDIPTLDCVIFATPKKDRIAIIQSCGRVGRKAGGKSCGIVLDIVDEEFPTFQRYFSRRKSIYKSKKYEVYYAKS